MVGLPLLAVPGRLRKEVMSNAVLSRGTLPIALLAWAGSVGIGLRTVFRYEATPGAVANAPAMWPPTSGIKRPPAKFALVLFVHPDCPCTRASIAELGVLMAQLHGKIVAFVDFRKPGASLSDMQRSDLWGSAGAIPGVKVAFDRDGGEAHRFDASVSGQALLYNRDGQLVFNGGITAARGHEGDNEGVEAVIRHVNGEQAPFHAPTFGCSLRDPSAMELNRDPSWNTQ
jgi:hypothetical protein